MRLLTQARSWASMVVVGGALGCAAGLVQAAPDYPNRPITLVVGFPPGGSNDIVARIIAPKLAAVLGTSVVVENRPGANAIIGTEYVARAKPDGYTLTLGSASPLAISPHTYSKMPIDPLKDLVGVTTVAATPEVVAVNPKVPANNLAELIALSKTRQINVSSSGNGGLPHLAIELLRQAGAGGRISHVPYKGAGPAVVDTVGGHVEAVIMDLPAVYGMVQEGRLRALATTNTQRAAVLPDLPTSVEQGYPGLLAFNWFAVMAPARTPAAIIERLHAALLEVVQAPEIRAQMLKVGVEPYTQASPAQFARFMTEETRRWGEVARASGAKAD